LPDLPDHSSTATAPPVTEAAAYLRRESEGRRIVLPSGDVVLIGSTSAVDLAAAGAIPDRLSDQVFRDMPSMLHEAGRAGDPEEARARLYRDRVETVNLLACAILREPRMIPETEPDADDPPEGAIYPRHMAWGDRLHLYRIATGEAQPDLARFPGEPSTGVHAAQNGDGVLDAAVGDPRAPA